jgi:hypothetical protein
MPSAGISLFEQFFRSKAKYACMRRGAGAFCPEMEIARDRRVIGRKAPMNCAGEVVA